MELDQKCQEVMEGRGWSQRQLAEALGITDKNLISMRRGRRPMPAHALIRLERLRGTDDHSIIEQLLKTAACVTLAIVLLLLPARENVAYASEAYAASINNNTNYGVFWRRVRASLAALFQKLTRPLRGLGMFIPA